MATDSYPSGFRPRQHGDKVARVSAGRFARLIAMLAEGVYSNSELAHGTGLNYLTVCEYVRELRKVEPKIIYVDDWHEDKIGHRSIKVYKLGNRPDAPRPRVSDLRRAGDAALANKRRREARRAAKLVAALMKGTADAAAAA